MIVGCTVHRCATFPDSFTFYQLTLAICFVRFYDGCCSFCIITWSAGLHCNRTIAFYIAIDAFMETSLLILLFQLSLVSSFSMDLRLSSDIAGTLFRPGITHFLCLTAKCYLAVTDLLLYLLQYLNI